MASRSSNHQTILSLNPAWCLRPISFRRESRSLREPSDDCTDTCSSSAFSITTTHSRLLVAEEPSSPKIGCMGQIRRGALPATARGHQHQQHAKMLRFRRILSGRSIASPHSSAKVRDHGRCKSHDLVAPVEDISGIDPPLPVVRREEKEGNAVGLWSRRCRGLQLEALQLQKPQLRCAYAAPSTAL